ncbi:hypothetical protein HDU93_001611 [Gonapodya sp. JEL0774]|nr:hypothetical protein HDU93_001611 [Gonapodya sp. JEL0774]
MEMDWLKDLFADRQDRAEQRKSSSSRRARYVKARSKKVRRGITALEEYVTIERAKFTRDKAFVSEIARQYQTLGGSQDLDSPTSETTLLQAVLDHRVQYLRDGRSLSIPPRLVTFVFPPSVARVFLSNLVLRDRVCSPLSHIPRIVLQLRPEFKLSTRELTLKPFFSGDLAHDLTDRPTPVLIPDDLAEWYNASIDHGRGEFEGRDGMWKYFSLYIRELALDPEEALEILELYMCERPADLPWAAAVKSECEEFIARTQPQTGDTTHSSMSFKLRYAGVSRVTNGVQRMAADWKNRTATRIINFLRVVEQVRTAKLGGEENASVPTRPLEEERDEEENSDEEDDTENDTSAISPTSECDRVLGLLEVRTLVVIEIPCCVGDEPELLLHFVGALEDTLILVVQPCALNSAYGGFTSRIKLDDRVAALIDQCAAATIVPWMTDLKEMPGDEWNPVDIDAARSYADKIRDIYYHTARGFAPTFRLHQTELNLTDPDEKDEIRIEDSTEYASVQTTIQMAVTQLTGPLHPVGGIVSTVNHFKDITRTGFYSHIPFWHQFAGRGPLTAREISLRVFDSVLRQPVQASSSFVMTRVFGPFLDLLPTLDRDLFYAPLSFLRQQLKVLQPIHITANGIGPVVVFLNGLLDDEYLDVKAVEESSTLGTPKYKGRQKPQTSQELDGTDRENKQSVACLESLLDSLACPTTPFVRTADGSLPWTAYGALFSGDRDPQLRVFLETIDSIAIGDGSIVVPPSFPCPRGMAPGDSDWISWARGLEEGKTDIWSANAIGHAVNPTQERRSNSALAGTPSSRASQKYAAFLVTSLNTIIDPDYLVRPKQDRVFRVYVRAIDGCRTRYHFSTPQINVDHGMHLCGLGEERSYKDTPYNYPAMAGVGVLNADQVFPQESAQFQGLSAEFQTLVRLYPFAEILTRVHQLPGAPSKTLAGRTVPFSASDAPDAYSLTALAPNVSLRVLRQLDSLAKVVGNPLMEWVFVKCGKCSKEAWRALEIGAKKYTFPCSPVIEQFGTGEHPHPYSKPRMHVTRRTRNIWDLGPGERDELFYIYLNTEDKLHEHLGRQDPFK